MNQQSSEPNRVVVTGVGIVCALGDGSERVWHAVRDGQRGTRLTTRLDVSKLSCHYSAELAEEPELDIPAPGRRPRGRLDRATRLALHATAEAIGRSTVDLGGYDPYRVGLAMGTSVGGLDEGERFHWQMLADA